ncbi:DUF3560 domain-containing protein [Nocardia salmonicida]|uniref:DUF3560 domain-containing protein n=1 Tax=Nocardia salmonicida TaxID=53431 RepID=UPI0037B05B92
MSVLTITHTHAEGTALSGSTKGDGVAAVLTQSATRWRYHGQSGRWIIRGTRDRTAPRAAIDRTADALRAAGYAVTIRIDDTPRPAAEVEADRATRSKARAAMRAEQADAAADAATAADAAVERAREKLPPLGQPVMTDHHSAAGHRRRIASYSAADTAAVMAHRAAATAAAVAAEAAADQGARENLGVTLRRIERLTAECARLERQLDGATLDLGLLDGRRLITPVPPAEGEDHKALTAALAQVVRQLDYWSARVTEAEAAGALVFGPDKVRTGDYVRIGARKWLPYKVFRVNRKTVTLDKHDGASATLPYHRITALADSRGNVVEFRDGQRITTN